MKKKYLTLLLSMSVMAGFTQSLVPTLPEYPVIGFEKILRENSYVLEQRRAANDTWIDNTRYTWIPSAIEPFRKESKTSQRTNNEWKDVQLNTDSFVLDNQNRIAIAIENVHYDYPDYTYTMVLKYNFTYAANNQPSKVVIMRAIPPTYDQFLDYYEIHYAYNGSGQRVKDSMFVYQTQESYISSHTYDGASNLIQTVYTESASDTITGNSIYTYTNNKLHTVYTEGVNGNNWSITAQDTFDYDNNGNVIRAIHHGMTTNGQEFQLMPLSNDILQYNNQNQLTEVKSAYWPSDNSGWRNSQKYTFSYNNNKPINGYMFTFDSAGNVWSANPILRLLFSQPTGVKTEPAIIKYEVSVYPNPASKNVNIYIPFLNENQEATITLVNTKGENITVPVIRNQKEMALDIALLAKGVYMLKVQTNTSVVTQKLVITE
ncbi:MAG: T9SS type A sorting domain-containing protein [Bacteroidota bacterium]